MIILSYLIFFSILPIYLFCPSLPFIILLIRSSYPSRASRYGAVPASPPPLAPRSGYAHSRPSWLRPRAPRCRPPRHPAVRSSSSATSSALS